MSSITRVNRDEVGSVIAINESEVPLDQIERSLRESHPAVAQMLNWAQGIDSRQGSLSERDRYLSPRKLFDQFRLAEYATENDNSVSGVADITEQLAFKDVEVICDDPQQQDVWNQILSDLDIETRMREIWRELFMYSNCYVGSFWGRKNYSVNAKTENGNKPRKQFPGLFVPQALSVMDVTRIVPAGTFMFGQEDLVYLASNVAETARFDALFDDISQKDAIFRQLMTGKYDMPQEEAGALFRETGCSMIPGGQYLLNPNRVFRITATRPAYKKFASVRMKSIFELLDLKDQLREMDRAFLLGAQSFILLVKVGSDKIPAKPVEMGQYASQFQGGARIPVVIGDHRLDISIISPPMTHVLAADKYRLIDSIISVRLYQVFHQAGDFREDDTKLIRVVTASMEARREKIRKILFDKVIKPCFGANDALTELPELVFHPRTISLAFDPNMATFMLDLRTMGDMSRYTILSELLNLDEKDEYERRVAEKDQDKAFRPVPDPDFTAPIQSLPQPPEPATGEPAIVEKAPIKKPAAKKAAAPTAKKAAAPAAPAAPVPKGTQKSNGRTGGGNSNGGGANRQSGRSGPARGPAKK